jgi:lactoylglutathione lyase
MVFTGFSRGRAERRRFDLIGTLNSKEAEEQKETIPYKKEEVKVVIHKIEAVVLFVQDLDSCTAFYRDTFRLPYQGSDVNSASFLLQEGLYLILLSPEGATDLLGTQPNEPKIEGGPRGLLAASVADVDAAYQELKAKGVTFVRPPTDQHWGLRTAHFVDPEGNLWEISSPIDRSKRSK